MYSSLRRAVALLVLLPVAPVLADPGHPVAIRRWEGGAISVETMWNLNVVVDLNGTASDSLKTTADYVAGPTSSPHVVVHRSPNASQVAVATDAFESPAPNGVRILKRTVREVGTNTDQRRKDEAIAVEVDGVKIVVIDADRIPDDTTLETQAFTNHSLVVLSFADAAVLKKSNVVQFVKTIRPDQVLLSPSKESSVYDVAAFQKSIDSGQTVLTSEFNTLAVSESKDAAQGIQVVMLSGKSHQLAGELSELFQRMEKSCSDSQKVFEKLSVNQMNWKPANGTHTPRWNTEHMMGRQLRFFSQIYHTIDPSIPVMDLNPKQMPDDYVYAHEDWAGAEEARQMERVSRFTRRFAYLLNGLDVNKKAPGSQWSSLRALLLQMERHYSEHTANTVKKFDLPDWPEE